MKEWPIHEYRVGLPDAPNVGEVHLTVEALPGLDRIHVSYSLDEGGAVTPLSEVLTVPEPGISGLLAGVIVLALLHHKHKGT